MDWVLRFIWWIPIPIKESAPLSEWLGFLGAYFGVIGAIAVVWWQSNKEKEKENLKALSFFHSLLSFIDERFEYFSTHFSSIIFESNKNLDLMNDNDFKVIFPLEESIATNLFINITENANFVKLFDLYQTIIYFQDKIKKYILETEKDFNEIQLQKIDNFCSKHDNYKNYINVKDEKNKFKTAHINFIMKINTFQEYIEEIIHLTKELYIKVSLIAIEKDFEEDVDFLSYSAKLSFLSLYLSKLPELLKEIKEMKEMLK